MLIIFLYHPKVNEPLENKKRTYVKLQKLTAYPPKVTIQKPVKERIPEIVAQRQPCHYEVQKWRHLLNDNISLSQARRAKLC